PPVRNRGAALFASAAHRSGTCAGADHLAGRGDESARALGSPAYLGGALVGRRPVVAAAGGTVSTRLQEGDEERGGGLAAAKRRSHERRRTRQHRQAVRA